MLWDSKLGDPHEDVLVAYVDILIPGGKLTFINMDKDTFVEYGEKYFHILAHYPGAEPVFSLLEEVYMRTRNDENILVYITEISDLVGTEASYTVKEVGKEVTHKTTFDRYGAPHPA